MELSENIMQLITRHLNNEASKEEQTELESWLKESPDHKQEYDAYVKLWEDSSDIVLKHQFNTPAAWQKVQKKIQPLPDIAPVKRSAVFSFKRLAAAAAIIVFISAMAIYLYNRNQESSWKTIAALNNNQQVAMPDGTVILLRKGSTLRYPESFGDKERTTELSGEAFFEVQHDEQKPFKVFTADAVVEVLGTSFLVRNTDSLDEVVVNSGRVRFAERDNISQQVILTKGQKAALTNKQFTRDSVLNSNYLSWENGKLIFHNTPLKQAVEDIGNLYNISIVLAPDVKAHADSISIKAEFDKQTLEQVIDEIQLMTGLKASRENGVVVLGK